MKKFTLALFMLAMPIFALASENYKIIRISDESLQLAIEKEKTDAQYRCIQKWATVGAAAAAVYGLIHLQDYLSFSDTSKLAKGGSLPVNENLAVVDRSQWSPNVHVDPSKNLPWTFDNLPSFFLNGACNVGQGVVDTSLGVSKWIVQSAAGFIGFGALSYGVNEIGNYWSYFNETEELSGFVKHQTKLAKLSYVMKEFAVPFDIYSERLSMDLNFGAQRVILSDFMKEMIEAVEISNDWSRNKLLTLMKKDFLQKTSSLQELQDYALHAMSCRQRIESGLVNSQLEIEQFNRASLAEFCNLLILEVERVTAFIANKSENCFMKNYLTHGVDALTVATNNFAAQVEAQLALPMADLYVQSKQGNGLFDLIFNYTTFLEQNIDAMSLRLQYQM